MSRRRSDDDGDGERRLDEDRLGICARKSKITFLALAEAEALGNCNPAGRSRREYERWQGG